MEGGEDGALIPAHFPWTDAQVHVSASLILNYSNDLKHSSLSAFASYDLRCLVLFSSCSCEVTNSIFLCSPIPTTSFFPLSYEMCVSVICEGKFYRNGVK